MTFTGVGVACVCDPVKVLMSFCMRDDNVSVPLLDVLALESTGLTCVVCIVEFADEEVDNLAAGVPTVAIAAAVGSNVATSVALTGVVETVGVVVVNARDV